MIKMLEYSLAARALTFGYSNARVKAMKQSLIGQKEVAAMIEAKNIAEIFAILERTAYRPDLVSGALAEGTIADQIELACTTNFSRTLATILKISPKKAREEIKEMFEKYEINNIKLIITSKHMNEPKEKIAQLIMDTGILKKATHNRMLDAKTVKECVSELGGTKYGSLLQSKLADYTREKQITPLIVALDNYYYSAIPSIAKNPYGDTRIISSMLKSEADAKNISTILRAKNDNIEPKKIMAMTSGLGNLRKEEIFEAARQKSTEDAAKIFEKKFRLTNQIEAFKKTGSLIPIELALEKAVAAKGL
ncbi:MAG: V-type ATPase subunit, partial [archaeon]|nr:V-type ATPase subunit [archaeon]